MKTTFTELSNIIGHGESSLNELLSTKKPICADVRNKIRSAIWIVVYDPIFAPMRIQFLNHNKTFE